MAGFWKMSIFLFLFQPIFQNGRRHASNGEYMFVLK